MAGFTVLRPVRMSIYRQSFGRDTADSSLMKQLQLSRGSEYTKRPNHVFSGSHFAHAGGLFQCYIETDRVDGFKVRVVTLLDRTTCRVCADLSVARFLASIELLPFFYGKRALQSDRCCSIRDLGFVDLQQFRTQYERTRRPCVSGEERKRNEKKKSEEQCVWIPARISGCRYSLSGIEEAFRRRYVEGKWS